MKTKLPPKLPVENQAFKLLKVTYQWSKNPVAQGDTTTLTINSNLQTIQTDLTVQESDKVRIQKVTETEYNVAILDTTDVSQFHFTLVVKDYVFKQQRTFYPTLDVKETETKSNYNVLYGSSLASPSGSGDYPV